MAIQTLHLHTDGGLALNSDGARADMPHELANQLSHRLGEALALLLEAAADACPLSGERDGPDSYHDTASRTAALVNFAAREVRGVMRSMEAYV